MSQICFCFFCWLNFLSACKSKTRSTQKDVLIIQIIQRKHLLQSTETTFVLDGIHGMDLTIFTVVKLVVHQSTCIYPVSLSTPLENKLFTELFYCFEVSHSQGLVCYTQICFHGIFL